MQKEKTENDLPQENTIIKKEWKKPEINKVSEVSEAENSSGFDSDGVTTTTS